MQNLQNTDSRKLFKQRTMVLKTLKDRGYYIPPGEEKLNFHDFLELYNEDHHHIYFPPVGEEKKGIYIYFEQGEDMNKKTLETRVSKIRKDYPDLRKLFFVLKCGKNKKKTSMFVKTTIEKGG